MLENRIFTCLDEVYDGGFVIRSYYFTPDGELVAWSEIYEKVQQADEIRYERIDGYGVPISLEEFGRELELTEIECQTFLKNIQRTKQMYISSLQKKDPEVNPLGSEKY